VLTLLETALIYRSQKWLNNADLPAFAAPSKHTSNERAPSGYSLQGRDRVANAFSGMWWYGVKFLAGTLYGTTA
jgi:hypothetical protein